MSSVKSYKASQRGQLVTVSEDQSAPVWSSPERNGKTTTGEVIYGPATVGTATGNIYTDAELSWIEVVRVGSTILFGVPSVSIIYLSAELVKLGDNPDYDSSKDTGLPSTGTTTSTTDPDPDTVQVSKKPGPNRVPVVASNGETVYVLVPASTTTTSVTTSTDTTDKTKKYLTWGLYGILGLGAVTLIVILVISVRKPTSNPKAKP